MHRNHYIVAPTSVHRITKRIPAFTTCHFHRNKPWRNLQQPLPSYGVFSHPFSLQTTASTPHDEPSVQYPLASTLIRRAINLDDDPFGFADDVNANNERKVDDEYVPTAYSPFPSTLTPPPKSKAPNPKSSPSPSPQTKSSAPNPAP